MMLDMACTHRLRHLLGGECANHDTGEACLGFKVVHEAGDGLQQLLKLGRVNDVARLAPAAARLKLGQPVQCSGHIHLIKKMHLLCHHIQHLHGEYLLS